VQGKTASRRHHHHDHHPSLIQVLVARTTTNRVRWGHGPCEGAFRFVVVSSNFTFNNRVHRF
jgi:stress-induced morphogen